MPKIPEGLQEHVIFTMDGRTWIESAPAAGTIAMTRGIERGWCKIIPQDKLREFLASLDSLV